MELSKEKIHFHNLDIIRLLAATTIVVAHAYQAWVERYGHPSWLHGSNSKVPNYAGSLLFTFIGNFNLGVETFFLISGFLITYLLLVEKRTYDKINIGRFYIRRALRILPLYYLSILIAPLLVYILKRDTPDYLINILFLNNFHAIETKTWDFPFAHFWSICIEEHFYLIWPWLIAYISNKKLPYLFASLILICIGYRCYAYLHYDPSYYQLYLHTLSRIDVMILGGVLAYIHFLNPIKLRISLLIRLSIYIPFIFFLFIIPNYEWDNLFMAMVKKYFYVSVIAFEMLNYLFNETAILNFKRKNILHYLGKTSYGIYMFGNMLIPFIIGIDKKIKSAFLHNIFIFLAANVIITCVISVISFELFEKYFLSFKNRFELIKTER